MDEAKQQLVDKLTSSTNILVTISRNPSIDQVAACIGLSLVLNKYGKHAAAVFSGKVPSTLEFLKPEETIEKTTDSLRDFIIAIDKSKADKLRYKVEDDIVRIFITPYKTSINEDDLQFSQGDFNVDVVIALGVKSQEDLDEAITAHGRILHDAAITSISNSNDGNLGTINWHDPQASSISELVAELVEALDPSLLDEQISTALLTGVVSETDRFSNEKTTPQTMSISASLMSAGANQQLVASKLEADGDIPLLLKGGNSAPQPIPEKKPDGELDIDHSDKAEPPKPSEPKPEPAKPEPAPSFDQTKPVETPREATSPLNTLSPGSKLMTAPPSMGGTLTANSQLPAPDPVTDPLSMPKVEDPQMLNRSDSPASGQFTPPPAAWSPPASSAQPPLAPGVPPEANDPNKTLTDLEKAVDSPHLVEEARDEVNAALSDSSAPEPIIPEPIQALNAQSLGGELHPDAANPAIPPAVQPPAGTQPPAAAPPPVPPPIPFQFGAPPPPPQQ